MAARVGHRFHPTDEELVNYFLRHKIEGRDDLVDDDIHVIDLCKFDPWVLPGFAPQGPYDKVWYFFYKREVMKKKAGKNWYNRSTKSGHWKPTGSEHYVKKKGSTEVIGIKRILVFYRHAIRTDWVIHEYEAKVISPQQVELLVLCKLMDRSVDTADASDCDEDKSTRIGDSDFENNRIVIPASEVDQELLMDSDFENNRIVIPASEVDQELLMESVLAGGDQQPLFNIDEGLCIDDLMFTDFDNISDGKASHFETEEGGYEMADSFLNLAAYPTDEDSTIGMDAEIFYNWSSHIIELQSGRVGHPVKKTIIELQSAEDDYPVEENIIELQSGRVEHPVKKTIIELQSGEDEYPVEENIIELQRGRVENPVKKYVRKYMYVVNVFLGLVLVILMCRELLIIHRLMSISTSCVCLSSEPEI